MLIESMSDHVRGKNVLITGGSSGLGKRLALLLSGAGAHVSVIGRDEQKLGQVKQESGQRIGTYACDVRDYEKLGETVSQIEHAHGPVQYLINSAGGNFRKPTKDLTINGWKALIDVVLNGTFHCVHCVGNRMIEQQVKGKIVNIVSTHAWTGNPGTAHSAAAKAGVLALTRTLAVEWAPYDIRVNAVAPGPFISPGSEKLLWPTEEARNFAVSKVPVGRFADVQEIADACLYVLSDYADFMNGEVLTIDGGRWLESGTIPMP